MCDAFDFIDGGLPETMKRFGDAVGKRIQTLGTENARQLAECLDIAFEDLRSIPGCFPNLFRSDIIEGCATAFQLDLRSCFRKSPTLKPEEEQELLECVRRWGPKFAAGSTETEPTSAEFVDLFLLTHALQQLDTEEALV